MGATASLRVWSIWKLPVPKASTACVTFFPPWCSNWRFCQHFGAWSGWNTGGRIARLLLEFFGHLDFNAAWTNFRLSHVLHSDQGRVAVHIIIYIHTVSVSFIFYVHVDVLSLMSHFSKKRNDRSHNVIIALPTCLRNTFAPQSWNSSIVGTGSSTTSNRKLGEIFCVNP